MSAPLVLLDGASMWFRSFFGVPSSIKAPDGRQVNALRGFLDAVARFSFLTNFEQISKGVLSLRDLVFFLSLIAICLYANVVALEMKKSA